MKALMIGNLLDTVLNENKLVLSQVSLDETEDLIKRITESKRIFIYGEGRSGLMGKAFAMRLMHSGYEVYVVGETITPSIAKDDLFIGISASGTSSSLLNYFSKSKDVFASTFLITAAYESQPNVDGKLMLRAATKYRRKEEPDTIQPLGSQFDQSVHLLLDSVIIALLQGRDSNDKLLKRHANIE